MSRHWTMASFVMTSPPSLTFHPLISRLWKWVNLENKDWLRRWRSRHSKSTDINLKMKQSTMSQWVIMRYTRAGIKLHPGPSAYIRFFVRIELIQVYLITSPSTKHTIILSEHLTVFPNQLRIRWPVNKIKQQ